MVKQRSLGPDNMDDGTDASSAFLDALRTRAMDDLHSAALEYGIVLKDLGASANAHRWPTRFVGLTYHSDSRHRPTVQGRHRAHHGQIDNKGAPSPS